MKFRVVNYRETAYVLQVRKYFMWVECIDGVCGEPYTPSFSNLHDVFRFAKHYASVRNNNVSEISLWNIT